MVFEATMVNLGGSASMDISKKNALRMVRIATVRGWRRG